MKTTTEFKKDFGKPFGKLMRELGFKGSGFKYLLEDENFIFSIEIQPSRREGRCATNLWIEFKSAVTYVEWGKYYPSIGCIRVTKNNDTHDEWWYYKRDSKENEEIAREIAERINSRIMPIIRKFKTNLNIFDQIDTNDLGNICKQFSELLSGISMTGTENALYWLLANYYNNNKNHKRALEFAKFGLIYEVIYNMSFRRKDYETIIEQNAGYKNVLQ